jgi:hypothetical protein
LPLAPLRVSPSTREDAAMKLCDFADLSGSADVFDDGYVGVRADLLSRILAECPGLKLGEGKLPPPSRERSKSVAFLSPAEVLELCNYWLEMRDRRAGRLPLRGGLPRCMQPSAPLAEPK